MPELNPALRRLMKAFEDETDTEWCRGLHSWLASLRDSKCTNALAWPCGLLAGNADAAQVDRRDAPGRIAMGSSPSHYRSEDALTRRDQAITYAAAARSVADLTLTIGRNSLFEVAHNAAFFAHLASTLWTYRALEGCLDDGPALYWADLASERTESSVGGDFALIVPIDDRRCKLAIVQAKRESFVETKVRRETGIVKLKVGTCEADIRRSVGTDKRQQIEILLEHERLRGKVMAEDVSTIFGALCFYAFWHRPDAGGGVLPPLVRSARDVKDRQEQERRKPARPPRYSSIPTTSNAVDLTTFLALHLSDPASNVGLMCDRADLPALIGINGFDICTVAMLSSPRTGWPLDYWTSLIKGLQKYDDMTPAVQTRPRLQPRLAAATALGPAIGKP